MVRAQEWDEAAVDEFECFRDGVDAAFQQCPNVLS
jgi:hypothetical protein